MITLRIALAVTSRLLRSRLLIVSVLFGLAFMIMMASPIISITELKDGGELVDARDMKAMYLHASIMILGWMANLVALILGSSVIRQDIKEATIFSVLSKPVSRWQYFTGSVVGAGVCQCIIWCIFAAFWLICVYLVDKSIQPLYVTIVFSEGIKSLLMLSLALAWSQRLSPWIAGALALLTFDGDNLMRHCVGFLDFLHVFPTAGLTKICTFPFPCFDGLDALLRQLGETSLEPMNVILPFIHLVDYLAVALLIAWLYFKKQDLSPNS